MRGMGSERELGPLHVPRPEARLERALQAGRQVLLLSEGREPETSEMPVRWGATEAKTHPGPALGRAPAYPALRIRDEVRCLLPVPQNTSEGGLFLCFLDEETEARRG